MYSNVLQNLNEHDYSQVNSFDLDVDALCDFNNEESMESIDLALREWQSTNSPITHWYNMVARYLNLNDNFYNPAFFNVEPSDRWTFYYGLPKEDAKDMCKTVYRETIAKVTIEILDPMVLQIKKDVSSTFTSRLGVVGSMNIFLLSCFLSYFHAFFLVPQGGTLGLFTGASILSLVEIVFWIYKVPK